MTSNRELLTLAAKAAGYEIEFIGDDCYVTGGGYLHFKWNPLTNDSDALRLAVKLRLDVSVNLHFVQVWGSDFNVRESNDNDPYAATRRAIVRAAAEIGKEQP